MTESLFFSVAVLVCYASSGVPYGLLLGKYIYGVDLRDSGSHNFGATNAVRVLGKKFGAVVFACDFLKAFLPLLALRFAYHASPALLGACAFAAVAGHVFPVWLKFRGGKGVASYLGVISAAHPALTGIFAVMWIGAFYRSRISALGALTALPGSAVGALAALPLAQAIGITIAAALCVYKHKENIRRLMRGEESRFRERP